MKYVFILSFIILAIVQWIIPGQIIWMKNEVLKKGRSYKFKTAPVDPSNPFKGKYIRLNFSERSFADTVNRNLGRDENVFVLLATDQHGYARITGLSTKQPLGNALFVESKVDYTSRKNDSIIIYIHYPFDEFFMDEYKAPKAEMIYNTSGRDSLKKTYALVKIWKGQAVIEDVFINDTSIRVLIK